ncbi:g12450 [Coccomyxa viridis]|uniref:G12450 protein n=1 Tax=Coccomyxa viridis TaxID=1274662 RepID=A0ABP1GAD2_9CHLO
MSLRELATASDVCTPADDGAGPSNALSSFTNTLLGRSSKAQERLRELPGVNGVPTPAPWAQAGPSSVEAAARAAAEGELMGIPGVSHGAPGDVEEFLAQSRAGHPGPVPREFADFERIYQGAQPGRPMGAGLPAGPMAGLPGLAPSLHAFLASAKIQGAFQPPPAPPLQLTQLDQCRIRDRSTIMARHLFADRGDAYADEQVGHLLHSLRIDPQQLPGQPDLAAFDAIYKAGALHHAHPSAAAEHAANARHLAQLQGPANGWVDDFSQLQLGGQPHEQWAQDFAAQQQNGRTRSWNQIWDESNGQTNEWATEFDQSQSATAAAQAGGRVENSAKALEQTKALADTLAADKDGKFANSKFLQFVSKMSRGEIILEGNEAKEIPAESAAWAQEFEEAAEHSRAQGYEDIWKHYGELQEDATGWADEFGGISQAAEQWADQFAEQIVPNEEVRSWLDDWESEATQAREAMAAAAADDYKFAENNPFLNDMNSLAKGKSLFQSGLLSEAVLALEAEVQRQPQNVEAWRLLGTVHAENDDDQQAIAALNKAMATDPNNAEVLLSLGVSYTNELDQGRALNFLTAWLSRQPAFTRLLQDAGPPQDSSQRLTHALATFERAAAQEAGNADVQVALGVLRSLARQYSAAGDAFRAALAIRPRDYSLWNKLGATLANSSSSQEAIAAYQKALDLKPNYMRAWTNMGIAQANVGNYETSARFYIRALSMNPKASSTWGYLRTSLACSGRMDLMELVHESNLDALQKELPL